MILEIKRCRGIILKIYAHGFDFTNQSIWSSFKNRFDQLMKEVHQPKYLIIKDEAGLDFKNQKINPVFHKMLWLIQNQSCDVNEF